MTNNIFTCGKKVKHYNLLGKTKNISLAWLGKQVNTYFSFGNKAKDFPLFEKTTKCFLLLWKGITDKVLHAETKPKKCFGLGNKKNIFCSDMS